MRAVLSSIALLCAIATVSAAANPGLRVVITNSGLTEIKDAALPIINAAFQDLTLPSMSLQEHVPVLGHISLDLSNMKVSGFSLPDAVFKVNNPPSIDIDLSGLALTVSLDYAWRKVHWPHISDHGEVSATPSGGDLDLSAQMTATSGHVVLSGATATVNFSGFDIHFSGKVGWLYNLLVGLFKGAIKNAVESAVQKQLVNGVSVKLNEALARMPVHETLGGGKSRVDVDIGIEDLMASSTYLSLGDAMGIANNMTGAVCPITAAVLPAVTPNAASNMIQLLFDDSFLNCVSWSATGNGALNKTVTQATIPAKFPIKLNTTAWAGIAPGMAQKFPNMAMQAEMSPQSAPSVKCGVAGMNGTVDLTFAMSVLPKAGAAPIPAFALGVNLALGLDVHVKTLNNTPIVVLDITQLVIDLEVESSQVGTINLGAIQGLLATITPLVKDLINGFLANGFPLPSMPGMTLVNPVVEFEPGFMAIGSSFTLHI